MKVHGHADASPDQNSDTNTYLVHILNIDTYKHIKADYKAMIKVKKTCILSIKVIYYLMQQMIKIQKRSGIFSKQSENLLVWL